MNIYVASCVYSSSFSYEVTYLIAAFSPGHLADLQHTREHVTVQAKALEMAENCVSKIAMLFL